MKRLDIYWMSNDAWYHHEGIGIVINDDAPVDAKKSYEHYCEQCEELDKQDDED